MALIQTITDSSKLYHDLQATSNYKDNFTYEGARALQSYLEELSEDMGEHIDYDPIAFCCEYSEYSDVFEAYSQYQDIDELEGDDEHDKQENALSYLEANTTVIGFNGGIIIQSL